MSTTVELVRQDETARVRFRNAKGIHILTAETRGQLAEVLEELEQDRTTRVVVFESEGRSFLAGADLKELKSLDSKTALTFAREGQDLMNRIEGLRQVTIAAIHAACAGGGCELALACDLRMAARSARIGLPEVSLGLLPGWGGTVRSVQLLGGAVARRIIFSGELFAAEDAYALGLLDSVIDDDSFRDAVDERVTLLLSRGPNAIRRVKRLIRVLDRRESRKKFRREARRFAACYLSAEPQEGINAFLEKREPLWERVGELR